MAPVPRHWKKARWGHTSDSGQWQWGWRVLLDPFAILGAGLYAQSGLGGYLFFVAGLLLASFLAYQLSQAAERSQQRSRELEKLEELGRAILTCCPDAPHCVQSVE